MSKFWGDETHIGDGVYASHDGYQVWLRVERPLEEWAFEAIRRLPKEFEGTPIVSERVALEPSTLQRLLKYVEGIENDTVS